MDSYYARTNKNNIANKLQKKYVIYTLKKRLFRFRFIKLLSTDKYLTWSLLIEKNEIVHIKNGFQNT